MTSGVRSRWRTCAAEPAGLSQTLQIAGEVMTGDLADPTAIGGQTGADHYHRDDVKPACAVGHKPIRTIGRHLFYRLGRLKQD